MGPTDRNGSKCLQRWRMSKEQRQHEEWQEHLYYDDTLLSLFGFQSLDLNTYSLTTTAFWGTLPDHPVMSSITSLSPPDTTLQPSARIINTNSCTCDLCYCQSWIISPCWDVFPSWTINKLQGLPNSCTDGLTCSARELSESLDDHSTVFVRCESSRVVSRFVEVQFLGWRIKLTERVCN